MSINIRVHELTSKKYEAQVSYFDPVSRRRVRKKFPKMAQAVNYQRQLAKEFESNGTTVLSGLPVGQFLKAYLNDRPGNMMSRLGKPIFVSFANRFSSEPITSVKSDDLESWLENLMIERNLSSRTLPNVKTAYSQFFDFAVEKGAMSVNPMHGVSLERGDAKRVRVVLDESEVLELLSLIRDASPTVLFPTVFLVAHTAARLGEILKLQWSQVNFDLGTVHFLKTKNGEDRLVHLSLVALEFLRSLRRDGEYVVHHPSGNAWTDATYRKQFAKFRKKISFRKHWTNHSLRHSFASNYLKQGGDMRQLQYILGHKNLQMTVDLYGQFSAEDVHEPSPFNF